MTRTLYFRVVATFIAVAAVSLFVSFQITFNLYQGKILRQVESEMTGLGKELVTAYQNSNSSDTDSSISRLYAVRSRVALFGADGSVKIFGKSKPDSFGSPEDIARVLSGGVHRFENTPGSLLENKSIGLPFEKNGTAYALFIKAPFQNTLERVRGALLTAAGLALAVGILLYLLATYLLVTPIKRLTALTSRIAKGHFHERAPDKRKDEIGELARSFNAMSIELSQLEQMRKEFVSNVSHELQSPLTSIRGFAAAMKENEFPREQQLRYLSIIEEESKRLARLSEGMLQLAALESRQVPFHPGRYKLDKRIRNVFLTHSPQWTEKQLEISLEKLVPVTIWADGEQLDQVWHNLLTNSIKYTPPGGEIRVEAAMNNKLAVIRFADTGAGISSEDLPRVFERFVKADHSRDRSVKGSGLGLSIVRKIIELHGGTVEIQSEPGVGTVVTVSVPVGMDQPD